MKTLSRSAARVLRGYIELSDQEKHDLFEYITEYDRRDQMGRRLIKEENDRSLGVTFGPAPTTCPCCGR